MHKKMNVVTKVYQVEHKVPGTTVQKHNKHLEESDQKNDLFPS